MLEKLTVYAKCTICHERYPTPYLKRWGNKWYCGIHYDIEVGKKKVGNIRKRYQEFREIFK